MKNSKAQGSTELLIILGVSFFILLVFIGLNQNMFSLGEKTIRKEKAQSTIEAITTAAEFVYKQGVGSRIKINLQIPDEVTSISLANKRIVINFSSGDSYHASYIFPIRGTIPTEQGEYLITVHSYEDGVYLFRSDTSSAGIVTNLLSPQQGTTWINWTWTNPTDIDFHQVTIYKDSVELATTTNNYYSMSGLLSNTSYTIGVQTHDQSGNINSTIVSHTASTIVPTVFITNSQVIQPQICAGEDNSNVSGQFTGSCDGIYPQSCGFNVDLISCNDGFSETHNAQRVNTTYYYGGIAITSYNSSEITCYGVTNVDVCYEWWHDASLNNCYIQVDADGGNNFSTVTSSCPGTSPGGVTCTNVTALEEWQCNNFFGTSGTRAQIESEGQRSGGKGTTIISWDALYFNVTYLIV